MVAKGYAGAKVTAEAQAKYKQSQFNAKTSAGAEAFAEGSVGMKNNINCGGSAGNS